MSRRGLRAGLGIVAVVALVLIASQIVIPRVAASDVEDRLTAGGGSAKVSVGAFPALRLLFGEGDRIEVAASNLDLDLSGKRREHPLEQLDGFDDVDIAVDDLAVGPATLDRLTLTRDGSDGYRLRAAGDTSPADLVAFGAERLGILGGPLAQIAFGGQRIAIDFDMELVENDGRAEVVSGSGTVAGIPTGPLGQLITEAVIARL